MKQFTKRKLAFLAAVLTATGTVSGVADAFPVVAAESRVYSCDGFDVTYEVSGSWRLGYQAMITVTNTGTETLENWSLLFDCASSVRNTWNAVMSDRKGSYVIASNLRYNHDIAPGESTVFGFTGSGEPYFPESFEYVSGTEYVADDDYTVSYEVSQVVGSTYYLDVTVDNNSDEAIENWKLDFAFPCTVTDVWNAELLSGENGSWRIGYAENAFIDPDSSLTFGMVINTAEEDISGLFSNCSMTQVKRGNTAEMDLPMRAVITDELGGEYRITWYSDTDELPVVSAYPESLDDLIMPQVRYSVSPLGAIQFTMPEMRGTATVETTFTEKPDMIMLLDESRHMFRMVPFQADEDGVSTFRLSGSTVIVPLKIIRRTTTTTTTQTTTAETTTTADATTEEAVVTTSQPVTEETTETTASAEAVTDTTAPVTTVVTPVTTAAESTEAVTTTETVITTEAAVENELPEATAMTMNRSYLSGSQSLIKCFKIRSNSNGTFEVDVYDLLHMQYELYGDEYTHNLRAEIYDQGQRHEVIIPSSGIFSYTSQHSGKITVEIIDYVDYMDSPMWCEYIWEQDVYVQKNLSLAESEQNALLAKYSPIVMYTNEEEYAPMKIEDIFAEIPNKTQFTSLELSTVYGYEDVPISDLQDYMAYNGNSGYLLDWTDSLSNNDSKSFKNIKGSFSNATVYQYYQEDSSYIYLNYYFFYGYDKKNGSGSHNMDRESMFVVLNKATQEPLYVVTGGHLPETNIKYKGGCNWSNELVKVPYSQAITPFSEGHPIVSAETYQHCVMPFAGAYETVTHGAKQNNNAGIVQDLETSPDTLSLSGQHVIFPANFHASDSLNHYNTKELPVDSMYGDNVLNYSGYWIDVLIVENAKCPPFLDRDYDKTNKFNSISSIDPSTVTKQKETRMSEAQFNNAYLFSLTTVSDFEYTVTGSDYVLTWEPIEGAYGYEIECTSSNGTHNTFRVYGDSQNTYTDSTQNARDYKIKAFYKVDRTLYDEIGYFYVYNKPASVHASDSAGTVLVTVRDADTNQILSGVNVYLDGTLVGTTSGGAYAVSVSSDEQHTIRTEKTGYIAVEYHEISVEAGETVSLDTLMQVPYDVNAPYGSATLTIKNAQTGAVMPNVDFVIRRGMNTTTGTILQTATSNASGVVTLNSLSAGNYTGVIEMDGYIKTVFNFAIIGGRSKSYEVHVSPILSGQQIRLVLSWGANPRDLDSHITGNGIHVYYYDRVAKGVNLDVDDTNGYGPETVTVNLGVATEGTYSYYVHRYAGTGTIKNSGATVKVYSGNTLLKTYSAEQAGSGDIWNVCRIDTVTGSVTDW